MPVAPNLLTRHFKVDAPNCCWVGDITYVPTEEGWLYLATVMDLYSRKVVGWSMSNRMQAELVNKALLMVIWQRKPLKRLIWHTDRDSQYSSGSHVYLNKYPSAQAYLGVYDHRFNQIVEAEEEAESATIRIPEVNRAFHAKVKIGTNKYPYTYIIDTGATITTISPKMYRANEGIIRKTRKKYTFANADESTHEVEEVFIDWIKIGGIELQNVRAVVKQKGDNLLGQNVLGKLKISIQKENNIINPPIKYPT
jgi:predicted aspartyl protease